MVADILLMQIGLFIEQKSQKTIKNENNCAIERNQRNFKVNMDLRDGNSVYIEAFAELALVDDLD